MKVNDGGPLEGDYDKYERRGYEVISEVTINCEGCGAKLATITKVKGGDNTNKTRFVCPSCQQSSFYHTVEGEQMVDFHQRIADINTEHTLDRSTNKRVIKQTVIFK